MSDVGTPEITNKAGGKPDQASCNDGNEATKGFSKKEIDGFINLGKQLAGKTVINAIKEIVAEGPENGRCQKTCSELQDALEATVPCDYCGYMQLDIAETKMLLNICLTTVKRDYRASVDLPSMDYAQDLFDKYNFLKKVAIAYYAQYMGDNATLMERVQSYRPDIDFSKMYIDQKSPTTLYIDPSSKKRLGIFCYYVDPDSKGCYYKSCQGT